MGRPRPNGGAPRLTPLPKPIKTRLAETRKHALALKWLLGGITKAQYAAAAKGGSSEELIAFVYPLERAFEILANFVVELSELGLELAGAVPDSSKAKVLQQLEPAGVISKPRRRKLVEIYGVRNEMQHLYPDIRAEAVHDAATELLAELPGFFGDYARWMRELGYGR